MASIQINQANSPTILPSSSNNNNSSVLPGSSGSSSSSSRAKNEERDHGKRKGIMRRLKMKTVETDLSTVGVMAFNFVSATAIVFVNKIIFEQLEFKFSTLLTVFHFLVTYLGILLCEKAALFKNKPLRHLDVLPITVAFCGFVVFNNLSLQYNSIGFYQLMKVMTTPVIVVLQYFIYNIKQDIRLTISLVPVVIGVSMATVSDVKLNLVGSIWAIAGILSTSFYQLFVKTKQSSLGANSFQVLKYQAPQAAVIVLMLVPIFDDVRSDKGIIAYFQHVYAAENENVSLVILAIVTSSICAFCVNLSIFLVVGKTSPVAYNVLGHFKLLVILSGGIIFFNGDTNPIRLLGMLIAFAGIVYYTHLKQNLANAWSQQQTGANPGTAAKKKRASV